MTITEDQVRDTGGPFWNRGKRQKRTDWDPNLGNRSNRIRHLLANEKGGVGEVGVTPSVSAEQLDGRGGNESGVNMFRTQ